MGGIFISYRRGDHIDVVLALGRRLVESFGSDQVFLDTESLRPGDRFSGKLEKAVGDSAVVLAVIHAQWLSECNANGVRRLDEPDDWVRKELELAVQYGKKIIPILLDETPMPRRDQLPESIRDVVIDCQAHRIRASSRGSDIEELVSQVDGDVALSWTPANVIETTPSRRPGRWLVALATVLAVLSLAAPSVLALNAAPLTRDELPETFQLTGWSLLFMCAPFLAAALVGIPRSSINSVERDLHSAPVGKYHTRAALPLAVVTLVCPLAVAVSLGNGLGILITGLIASLGIIYVASKKFRSEKNEDELRRNWAYRLPARLHPAVLRQGVALLDDQLKEWRRPPSKEKREKALWMLDALDQGTERIRETAERGRRCWLTDRPWWIIGYMLWVAITVGLAAATAVALLRTGHASWRVFSLPVIALVVSGALSWGTMDFVYRRHRWQGRAVATEVTQNVEKLRRRLNDLLVPGR
ncbi:MAG: toll/interleukin-1 receptor domain-containing protein [Pseudonocardiaceae bacterium]